MTSKPEISVVMPFRDEGSHIAEQLEALAGQETTLCWEFVAVDNGSRDESRQIVESYRHKLPSLVLVSEPSELGPAPARNTGVTQASGDIILHCDADDVVAPGWIEALASATRSTGLAHGRRDIEALNPIWVRDARPGSDPGEEPPERFLPVAGTNNLGVSRRLHDEVGGFDASFFSLSDVDFVWRAQLSGARLVVANDAVVQYRYPQTPMGLFRQSRSYAIGTVRLDRRYGPHGLTPTNWRYEARRWAIELSTAHHILLPERRARWMWRLGYRVGTIQGWLRRRPGLYDPSKR
ncbi:MAG: glycosyltransferase family A protein [Acidimicrobiia bacterium]